MKTFPDTPVDLSFPAISLCDLEEFRNEIDPASGEYLKRREHELNAIPGHEVFTYPGYCYTCGKASEFAVDFLYASGEIRHGKPVPNWRERLVCKSCGLNNRIRACVHFLERNCLLEPASRIYITEQATPLYETLKSRYAHLVGSEYFGEKIPFGAVDPDTGYRNESILALSFADASLDYVLTFDVLEHVPDYQAALREFARVLAPGGRLVFTVPFALGDEKNIVRAEMTPDGEILHHMEPDYHGDPINAQGCLCFYIFAWQLLEEIRELGFSEVKANYYWSDEFAYLGEHQVIFSGIKK